MIRVPQKITCGKKDWLKHFAKAGKSKQCVLFTQILIGTMSSSLLGDKCNVELKVNGTFMKLDTVYTSLYCKKQMFLLPEKHRFGY